MLDRGGAIQDRAPGRDSEANGAIQANPVQSKPALPPDIPVPVSAFV
jgi:hypothetical protein